MIAALLLSQLWCYQPPVYEFERAAVVPIVQPIVKPRCHVSEVVPLPIIVPTPKVIYRPFPIRRGRYDFPMPAAVT